MRLIKYCVLLCVITAFSAVAEDFETNLKKMESHPGFVDFYWDESTGKLYLGIEQLDTDLLYINYLQSGVGSNDIGLDRGQIGGTRLVQFQRRGNKILMVQPNQRYRAHSDNALERKAVADGFAQSVLWGGEVVAELDGQLIVDWTDFLLRDSQGIGQRLAAMNEGQFSVDASRSAIDMRNSKNFPKNTELEAIITLQGQKPGPHVSSVAPTADVITVRTHHALVQLPDEPYQTRAFDPRSGGIPISFDDYAAPLGAPMRQQWVIRHRLEKTDPNAAVSDVVEPIVYYLDPGTPEPVRSALLDGAKWWESAFAAAGFTNAYRVELLPEDADPLDIRYNTIQWVHRSTRGWSYGASIVDPRSGEILKGHVTLGSLRVRQDMLIAQALLSPYDGKQNPKQAEQAIQDMALARLRQLSAHEVGHTLGLIHNFYASSKDRASVMDYPHPLVQVKNGGELDLTEAYDVGIGDWDKVSLAYLYQTFPGQDETEALNQLLEEAKRDGHVFIADRDARATGGSHPYAHLWDNGKDAAQGLLDVLKVRKKALFRFGLDTIQAGQPLADLERFLVPVYLFHRYQTEAAVKLIAGVDYHYALKGESGAKAQIVNPEVQQQALDAVLLTLDVRHLALNPELLPLLLPPVEGSYRDREHFKHRTGLNFDALGVAETAASHSLGLLLNPARLNRLVEHHARESSNPSLKSVLQQLWQKTWGQSHKSSYQKSVQEGINWATLNALIQASQSDQLAPTTKAKLWAFLQAKSKRFKKSKQALQQLAHARLKQALELKAPTPTSVAPPIPPGSPIGHQPGH